MWKASALVLLVFVGLLRGQDGQGKSRPGWPCVPGRAVDPAYLATSESTGGQLFLFQRGEVAHASVVMGASYTHPAAILRAVGNLNGTRDFEFPVDSTVASLLVLVSLQCRNSIRVSRPNGSELTAADSALSTDLQAGRILRVDQPEPGPWKVRLTGSGLFVLSVNAKANIALRGVGFYSDGDSSKEEERPSRRNSPLFGVRQRVEARVSEVVSNLRVQIVDATANPISEMQAMEAIREGAYRSSLTPQAQRIRILITGTDASAWPFQRMEPKLFQAEQPE